MGSYVAEDGGGDLCAPLPLGPVDGAKGPLELLLVGRKAGPDEGQPQGFRLGGQEGGIDLVGPHPVSIPEG